MSRTTIEKLVPGGEGFARLEDGLPVFVPGAFPGDVVSIERLTKKKQFARAEQWQLVTPSTQRRTVPCAVFERCGGCDWMPLPEAAQREQKLALLDEALRRTGHFKESLPVSLREVGDTLAYRQRVRLHFDERGHVGYFARRSHDVVSAEACCVVAPELASAIAELESVVSSEAEAFLAFGEVEVRALGQQRSLSFVLREGQPAPAGLLSRLRRRFVVAVRGVEHGSVGFERWPSTEGTYLLAAPGSFTQVNWTVNRAIVDDLLSGVARRGIGTFLDLYCGVGNFSLPLLGAGLSGYGVDDDANAIMSAKRAALAQAFPSDSFGSRDVARWLKESRHEPYDLVVVDPPRAGIQADLASIVRLCRRSLFLCSCDPVTFARDLRRFVDLGLSVESIVVYDMFPQTHHFEVACWLTTL
jgi:23S rRNA (uracil1939-C5)-methyltransferase